MNLPPWFSNIYLCFWVIEKERRKERRKERVVGGKERKLEDLKIGKEWKSERKYLSVANMGQVLWSVFYIPYSIISLHSHIAWEHWFLVHVTKLSGHTAIDIRYDLCPVCSGSKAPWALSIILPCLAKRKRSPQAKADRSWSAWWGDHQHKHVR